MRPAARKLPPFSFVLDILAPLEPASRPMFGCTALYVGAKIVLVLRKRRDHPSMNGVWVATKEEFHESLRRQIPCLRSIPLLGKGVTQWQMIGEREAEFESSVLAACDLVLRRDPRVGTVPKARPKRR